MATVISSPSMAIATVGPARSVNVQFLNVGERLALTDEGDYGDIRRFLDEYGNEVDEDVAIVAVIEWSSGTWSCVRLDAYQIAPEQ